MANTEITLQPGERLVAMASAPSGCSLEVVSADGQSLGTVSLVKGDTAKVVQGTRKESATDENANTGGAGPDPGTGGDDGGGMPDGGS